MNKRIFNISSQLEYKSRQNQRTIQLDAIVDEDLEKLAGKLFFWSFTVRKPKTTHYTKRLRVSTHNFVPKRKMVDAIEGGFVDGCEVKPVIGYSSRHTVDIRLSKPMQYGVIQKLVAIALQDLV